MINFNDFAALLLRSKFHWLMGSATMLIEVTGSKTGKRICLPVNFIREGLDLWVISSRERVWWRNLRQNPQATTWVGGKQAHVRAELVLEQSRVAERLLDLCARQSWMAGALKIGLDENRRARGEDLQRAAGERLFVQLKPE